MQVDSAIIASPALNRHAMDRFSEMATKLDHQLNLRDDSFVQQRGEQVNAETNSQLEEQGQKQEEQGEEDDYEFSFVCDETSSPISADDLFDNGQIRPIFPWFGTGAVPEPLNVGEEEVKLLKIPVKKVFVEGGDLPSASYEAEDINRIAEGPYCVWSKRTESAGQSASTVPESCRKSNSTGFSKLWRFRDLIHRSHSDGKDKFVFLTMDKRAEKEDTTSSSSSSTNKNTERSTSEKKSNSRNGKVRATAVANKTTPSKAKMTTPSSSYAAHYGKNGEQGREKRRSYLPYRQDLVGFFTSANSMSRNVHPY